MTWAPLAGVRTGAYGSTRALRFASSTLASLGAEVVRIAPPWCDPPPAADPAAGGAGERERRLDAWLDAGVSVVPVAAGGEAAAALSDATELILHDPTAYPPPAVRERARTTVAVAMGPDPEVPACGLTAAARAGVAIAVGAPDREPLGLPFDLADYAAGLMAATAAVAALGRDAGAVEVDAVGVLASFAGVNGLVYEPYGIPWTRERRRASQCGGPYPYGFLRASDGWVCAIARSRTDWDRLVAAMGDPAWAHSERYASLRRNGSLYADELDRKLEAWTGRYTRAELAAISRERNLALAPLRTSEEVLADPELRGCAFAADDAAPRPLVPVRPTAATPAPARARVAAKRNLAGLRVVDLGWVWSAPLAAAGLADLGADVIKVEHPARVDNSRLRGRPDEGWNERDDGDSIDSVPYFLNLNRGKRSVAIDFKDERGNALMRELLAKADVVIDNLGEDRFGKLGLHHSDLIAANPGLIWLSMPATSCGPATMRGYAPTISSYAGLEASIGYPDETTGMMTFGLCDPVAGTWGLLAVLAALQERGRTGRGRHLRLGQLEGLLALLGEMLEESDREGGTPPRGNFHPYFWPHGTYPTADGRHVAVAALDDGQRTALAAALGTEVGGREQLDAALRDWIAERDLEETVVALRTRVACEPCASYMEAREDPALRARGLLAALDHESVGRHLAYRQPWREDGAPLPIARPAPILGADTAAVLHDWLALGDAELEELDRSSALPGR